MLFRTSYRLCTVVILGAVFSWPAAPASGQSREGTLEQRTIRVCAALNSGEAGAEEAAQTLLREMEKSGECREAVSTLLRRHEVMEKAATSLLKDAALWNRAAINEVLAARSTERLPGPSKTPSDHFPADVYLQASKAIRPFDPASLSRSQRELLGAYDRYKVRKLEHRVRGALVPPSSTERMLLPITESLIVLPLLGHGESGFVISPDEFLPSWSKRPYFVTKLVEFSVLVAKNLRAAEELDLYLSRLTSNPHDDYSGHFHEHLAMIYRRNNMLDEARREVEAAVEACDQAGMATEKYLSLRTLIVDGLEQGEQYQQAGEEAFIVLRGCPPDVDRRGFRDLAERMLSDFVKAGRPDLAEARADALPSILPDARFLPEVFRVQWTFLRKQGLRDRASEVLVEMAALCGEDEQYARCKLDVARDCFSSGRMEDAERITREIVRDFSEHWVAVEAAELLDRCRNAESDTPDAVAGPLGCRVD